MAKGRDISNDLNGNTGSNSEAFRKWFRFGHLTNALQKAGESAETVQKIANGTYSSTDPVRRVYDDSNSF
jgi:hypothetical protein